MIRDTASDRLDLGNTTILCNSGPNEPGNLARLDAPEQIRRAGPRV
jgi:hypothetical protein